MTQDTTQTPARAPVQPCGFNPLSTDEIIAVVACIPSDASGLMAQSDMIEFARKIEACHGIGHEQQAQAGEDVAKLLAIGFPRTELNAFVGEFLEANKGQSAQIGDLCQAVLEMFAKNLVQRLPRHRGQIARGSVGFATLMLDPITTRISDIARATALEDAHDALIAPNNRAPTDLSRFRALGHKLQDAQRALQKIRKAMKKALKRAE